MGRIVTCGIFIKYKDSLLIVHPTGTALTQWSIPKGEIEIKETELECAIRETYEETNLNLQELFYHIKFIGTVDYLKTHKTLHAFMLDLTHILHKYEQIKDVVINNKFKCTSLTPKGYPENNFIQFHEIQSIKNKSLLHETQMRLIHKI